jgi:hypothetical protein
VEVCSADWPLVALLTCRRRHFLRDLEPLVCIFEDCQEPKRLYHDENTWIKHMEQFHSPRKWICSDPRHERVSFENETAYEEHMWSIHPGTFSKNHLETLKRIASRPTPLLSICPLCKFDPLAAGREAHNAVDKLLSHIAKHLRILAMMSLPWVDEDGEEGGSECRVIASDHVTTRNDEGLPPATFDENDLFAVRSDRGLAKVGPMHDRHTYGIEIDTESALSREWGFIEYVSYYGHDRDPVLQTFLRKAYIESTPYPVCGKYPCYIMPLVRNESFFARNRVLDEVAKVLCPASTTSTDRIKPSAQNNPRTFAIHGPGGMGKTQVATEFAYRYKKDFDVILWVHAGDATSLNQGFNEIALRLGIVAEGSPEARDLNDTRELVKRWLLNPLQSAGDTAKQISWLLVYDGADDSSIINEFWPYDAPGSVLITSRSPFSWTNSLQLEPFSDDEATRFLLKITSREQDDHSISEVATVNSKLGGLPLAL